MITLPTGQSDSESFSFKRVASQKILHGPTSEPSVPFLGCEVSSKILASFAAERSPTFQCLYDATGSWWNFSPNSPVPIPFSHPHHNHEIIECDNLPGLQLRNDMQGRGEEI